LAALNVTRVTRGWMDVQIQAVMADIADSLGLKKPEGGALSLAEGRRFKMSGAPRC
jgi:hypothetical protein